MGKSVLVTGANGQLGRCLQQISTNFTGVQFSFFERKELPLDDFDAVRKKLQELAPNVVINAGAYTAVDKAETETQTANLINGDAVGNLARVCKDIGARFIHVSTDYVFDGNATFPYKETDDVSPVNKYGASKLEGEQQAIQNCPHAVIVRTSWVYSKYGNNFVKTMLRLMSQRPSVGVVNDQQGCPTYAVDLAEALMSIAMAEEPEYGIYHFSNSGPITWYDFAQSIRELSGSTCEVKAISTIDFPTPAKRPLYSVMSNEKISRTFGIAQKPWKESLKKCMAELQAEGVR